MLYHSAKGSVDYTIVGTPTIVDGVVSNFSLSSYVQIPAFMPGNKTWALQLKFKLNSSMTNSSPLFNDTSNDFRCPKVTVIPGTSSLVFRAFVSTTGSSWNVSSGPQRRVSFDYSKWAYILWEFTGSQYILSFKQEGQDYSIITTINSTEPFYQNQNQVGMSFGNDIGSTAQYNSYIDGSIDLNETYIKINGQPWFGICPIEVKKHQIMGPVGYTVVGSPTITNGVASGFSRSDYLVTSNNIPLSDVTRYKFGAKFTTGSNVTGKYQNIIAYTTNSGGIYSGIRIINSGNLEWFIGRKQGSSTEQISIISSSPLNPNTTYYLKAYSILNIAYLDISTDGVNYNNVGTVSILDDIQIYTGRGFGIGENPSWPYYAFSGSIDLNNTYIKVNGQLWFWQPQETKRIVVNGVEVWTKPE